MRRTWKQQLFFLSGWAVAAVACLLAWAAGYNLGWLQGYTTRQRFSAPQQMPRAVVSLFDGPSLDASGQVSAPTEPNGLGRWFLNVQQQLKSDWYPDQPIPGKASG
jgi:hypothetical protein